MEEKGENLPFYLLSIVLLHSTILLCYYTNLILRMSRWDSKWILSVSKTHSELGTSCNTGLDD